MLAQPGDVSVGRDGGQVVGDRELTTRQEVEAIADVALVAHEVNASLGSLFRQLLVFALLDLRAKGDTATQDYVGVVPVVLLGRDIHVAVLRDIEVGTRAHLADVRGNRTLELLQVLIVGLELEVVGEGILRLRVLGV